MIIVPVDKKKLGKNKPKIQKEDEIHAICKTGAAFKSLGQKKVMKSKVAARK